MGALRLDRTFTCEHCWQSVKPVIVSREFDSRGVLTALKLGCPLRDCWHEWRVSVEELRSLL